MLPKYVLIAGSAAPDCHSEKLERARQFVAAVTEEIIRTGNGVAVLAGREPASDDTSPTIFDWTVLRAVEQFLNDRDGNAGRVLARVITGADSITKRFSPENAQLIQRLQAKGAIDVCHIEEKLYSGGSYRERQADLSDALIAIGGGRGTYIIGDQMLADGKPVMPMDIAIGSRSNDGGGALDLLSEMKTDQRAFLPCGHEVVNRRLYALSLEQPAWSVRRVARTVAKILAAELEVIVNANPPGGMRKFLNKMVGKTPAAAQSAYHATRTAETFAQLFE